MLGIIPKSAQSNVSNKFSFRINRHPFHLFGEKKYKGFSCQATTGGSCLKEKNAELYLTFKKAQTQREGGDNGRQFITLAHKAKIKKQHIRKKTSGGVHAGQKLNCLVPDFDFRVAGSVGS